VSEPTPRILVLGAHPDDADIEAGGTAALWRDAGFVVRLVSLTDGRMGHHLTPGPAMAARRRDEARSAGAVIGAEYEVLDIPDGSLDDRLEYRHRLIRLIRAFRPDLIVTHRTIDYHPDHRFAGQLVQDAAYLLTVPGICPDLPHLDQVPIILFFQDGFTRPSSFQPDVVVDVGPALDRVVAMLDRHVSQFYEWLPFNAGYAHDVPRESAARRVWLGQQFRERIAPLADQYRDLVVAIYGADRGEKVAFIEAFEVSEQGSSLDAASRRRLFPFLPAMEDSGTTERKRWVDRPASA
jgi:LmbE family N-acetylglucosaminyl deacetylase